MRNYVSFTTDTLSITAIILNLLLIFIIWNNSKKMGGYKYILIYFAFFECLYAGMVFITKPVFYIHGSRSVIFCDNDMITDPHLAGAITGLYCSFYQMWLGLVVVMFTYRYLILCKEKIFASINNNFSQKIGVYLVYLCHVTSTIICGQLFCASKLPKDLLQDIVSEYHIKNVQHLGYAVITFTEEDGSLAWKGFASFGHHSFVCTLSIVIMIFCGIKISQKLANWGGDQKEFTKNRQIFLTLVLQGSIPVAFYQIPLFFMLIALFYQETAFGQFSPFISIMTTLPKVLDPLFTILVIKDYRIALKRLFRRMRLRRVDVDSTRNAYTDTNTSENA